MTKREIRRRWLEGLQKAIVAVSEPLREIEELRAYRYEVERDHPGLRGLGVDAGLFGAPEALLFRSVGSECPTLAKARSLVDRLASAVAAADARERGAEEA